MTTTRRSVEQTIASLAMRQLRERASLAGTPAARSDASAALALLLDYRPTHDYTTACTAAIEHQLGCVEVPLQAAAEAAQALDGTAVHLCVIVADYAELQTALALGAHEVTLPATVVLEPGASFTAGLAECVSAAHAHGATLKLALNASDLSMETLCRLACAAHAQGVDLIGVPAAALAVVRASGCREALLKASAVDSLESARLLLSAGAVRLGVLDPWPLLAAARR